MTPTSATAKVNPKPQAATKPTFTINEGGVAFDAGVPGATAKKSSLVDFTWAMSERIPLETGLLPPGTLAIRQAGDHLQIVVQHPPGIYPINWAAHEGDGARGNYEVVNVAQPWRIVVGDFIKGNILGARTFYSWQRVTDIDMPLYHANVPNLNCKGYNGTGVGWLCLYHNDTTTDLDIGGKTDYLIDRASGIECYNDANMSGTDGPRFYASMKKPHYVSTAKGWEEKTEKDGFMWTLDPDLWIPVLVDPATCDRHVPGGTPFTLRMAMEGPGQAYYQDPDRPRLIDLLRTGHTGAVEKLFHELFYGSVGGKRRQERNDRPYRRGRKTNR